MELYIAEKPSLAQAIAKGIGEVSRKDGFIICKNNKIVTWCFGHILENFSPEDYDAKYKSWSISDLPINPNPWKLKVKDDCKKQFKIIKELINDASSIVNAGDPDREGQLLVDEVLQYCDVFKNKIPVKRILLNALDDKSVKNALSDLKDNNQFLGMRNSALARSRADWFLGMNMTRFFTCKAHDAGYQGHDAVISVGRVQTPTTALVVRREEEINNFKSVKYFQLNVTWQHKNGELKSVWKIPDDCPGCDSENRLLDSSIALSVAKKIENAAGEITNVLQKKGQALQRLPYSLSALQIEAGRKYGYSAQQVLDTQQSLYEKKLTSYPRSDCDYLPENQLADAPQILSNLKSIPYLYEYVSNANPSLKSRAWNDKKISAHHAIIPTTVKPDFNSLSEMEQNCYLMVAKAYLAQFYPVQTFLETKIEILCADEQFNSSGKVILDNGWKKIYQGDSSLDDEKKSNDENAKLPSVQNGDKVQHIKNDVVEKNTKPPKRFTEATLIKAMKEISKFVHNPELKSALKECSGIGTEATRAGIIEKIKKANYVSVVKKELVPTDKAKMLLQILPESFTYPDLTAEWENSLDEIAKNKLDAKSFASAQNKIITKLFADAAAKKLPAPKGAIKCPNCGSPMRRIKGPKGYFWGCSGYPKCSTTAKDNKGKPIFNNK